MHGTWQTTGGGIGPVVRLLAAVVAAVVLLSWLATVLWLLAVIGAGLLLVIALLLLGLVRLLRRPEGEAEALAAQASALRGSVVPRAMEAGPAIVVHYHGGTHLHLEPGADAAEIIARVVPARTPDYLPVDQ